MSVSTFKTVNIDETECPIKVKNKEHHANGSSKVTSQVKTPVLEKRRNIHRAYLSPRDPGVMGMSVL